MDFVAVLLTGLLAGGLSCTAVHGGLLAGLLSRQKREAEESAAPGSYSLNRSHPLRAELMPVGAFLIAKLFSHALLGAALGALGSVAEVSVQARSWLQLAAGALVISFGLAQLNVPAFRRIAIRPPTSWAQSLDRQAWTRQTTAPALLGAATVLLPCGVTVSVQALALASGSALNGAALMAVFVLGTSPVFGLFGYAAQRAARAWRGRFGVIVGLAVLIAGLYTLNGGLELLGSPLAATNLTQRFSERDESTSSAVSTANGAQEVNVIVSSRGYSPRSIRVRSGIPTTMTLRSVQALGCVRSFAIPSRNQERSLPENGTTRIALGTLSPGILHYSCSMGMYTGRLIIG